MPVQTSPPLVSIRPRTSTRPVRKDEVVIEERGLYIESGLPERRSRRKPLYLLHGEAGPPILLDESDRGEHVVAGGVGDDGVEDDALVGDDLAVLAVEGIILAVRTAHHHPVGAAGPEVHFAHWQGEVFRAPPARHMFGIDPHLKHETARRVVHAGERDRATVRQRGWVGVRIDGRPDWAVVATLGKQAYREVAPPRLRAAVATE